MKGQAQSERTIRVFPAYLTDVVASERLYSEELTAALTAIGVQPVSDWRKADVIHLFEVNFLTRDALTSGNIPELVRMLRSDIPVVASTDDLYFTGDPSLTARPAVYHLNARLQRWLFDRCAAVIAISHSVKRTIEPRLATTPVHVVHHGVSDRYFNGAPGESDPYVLHVSFPSKRKNPEAIMEVARRLDRRFVVAGKGWEDVIPPTERAETLHVPGYVTEDELVDLYREAAIFYFPTLHEGFGLPLLEAMAASNAVVASNVYSVPEVTGETAMLHDPTDIDAHLASLRELLRNPSVRDEMGAAAKARARTFSWDETAANTRAVYDSVLSEDSH